MNKEFFLRHIESSRDCEQGALDRAVGEGIRRAKSERFDARKICALAAAAVFSFAVFFTVSPRTLPRVFENTTENYYRTRNSAMPGSSAAIDRYAKLATAAIRRYLGGE